MALGRAALDVEGELADAQVGRGERPLEAIVRQPVGEEPVADLGEGHGAGRHRELCLVVDADLVRGQQQARVHEHGLAPKDRLAVNVLDVLGREVGLGRGGAEGGQRRCAESDD